MFALASFSFVHANGDDGKETCASKYPNAPTQPPRGYEYENESDAYMAFRRVALSAGYTSIKKTSRRDADKGPCVDHGKHVNMKGTRRPAKGNKPEWTQVGSMSSCEICKDTSRGPRFDRTVWRIHPDF